MAETAGADAASRLEVARGLLRRLERPARLDPARAAPTPGDDGRVLPVPGPLARVLPAGGLRRGSTVAVGAAPGATSLLFALLVEASASGAWAAVVGRPDLGALAAAEAGVRLDRLALVPDPGRDLVAVVAALVDGLDVVALAGHERAGVRAADRQRLAARARQRGTVLIALGVWPGADLELTCTRQRWDGLVGGGAGRLRARRAGVRVRGRGIAPGGREARLLLPGPVGAPEAIAVPGPDLAAAPVPARVAAV
ncbi:hypothetical protein [Pseudonocardia sp. N23]|uniref:hypothetical protein n=1 Tax=Pseudonocardia sp. N23 TaxID=1987376 RepID=UPI000C035142|nr:hypothetical protein [Pseudonocardia sp. N23]GAY10103.1 hypothetical protein TOK_4459 [Pseudonocardia sp. N23]